MVGCVTRAGRRSNLGLRGAFFRKELCSHGQKELDREVTGKEALLKIQGEKKTCFRCDNKREQRVLHTQEMDLTSLCTC